MGALIMKKEITISNLLALTNNEPLLQFGNVEELQEVWLDYSENFSIIDHFIKLEFGDKVYKYSDKYADTETLSELRADALSVIFTRAYKYKTLFESMSFVYNPLENYNRVEKTTVQRNLKSEGNLEKGTQTDNDTYSSNKAPFNGGSQPYDNGNSSHTEGTRTDKDARTDNEQTTTESTISGNIGVTTSQQMLESQRKVADFVFWKKFTEDVINEITLSYWDWGV